MDTPLFDPDDLERRRLAKAFGVGAPPVYLRPIRVAGLFAGIGGIELGLQRSGADTRMLCEWSAPAQATLRANFPNTPLVGDVQELGTLPEVDVVTAGFPCTDLSQAGRKAGIDGKASGLVREVFRLISKDRVEMLMLENVRNMLSLDRGAAMRFLVDQLESLGYRWAYRLVDSRFTGVPQRRQRVIFLASQNVDPTTVLFADDAGEPTQNYFRKDAFSFYWTEGRRGLGWAQDATPTLKAGSTIGIPSPPSIWNPNGEPGSRIVLPSIEEAEALQGFPRGWTAPASDIAGSKGARWRQVGNAVSVGVSRWVGQRLSNPGERSPNVRRLNDHDRWPSAACGTNGERWAVDVSLWPTQEPYQHLSDLVNLSKATPLSARATTGFYRRTQESTLNFEPNFLSDVHQHAAHMTQQAELGAVAQ